MAKLTELLFPPKCLLCSTILPDGQADICRGCREKTLWFSGRRSRIQYVKDWTAVWFFEQQVRKSILRYKFGGRRQYAKRYAPYLAKTIRDDLPGDIDVISFVPVSPLRRLSRGYDQAELLARAVAPLLGLKMLRTLKKVRHTPKQSRLGDIDMRRANVLNAYRPFKPENYAGKRVLLLDDIITTGATTSECAKVLLLAGAKEVYCAALGYRRAKK